MCVCALPTYIDCTPSNTFHINLQQSHCSDSDLLFSVSLALSVVPSTIQALTSFIPFFSDIYYSYALCEGDDGKQS